MPVTSAFARSRRVFQLSLLFAALLMLTGADPDARFQTLGHRLMCQCGCNQVLLECNHVGCPLSDGMRRELASYVERGDSDDLVLQAFVQKYGPTVLLAPTTTGFNRIAWIMPYLVLTVGVIAVYLVVRAWRKLPAPALADGIRPVAGPELDRYRAQARKETDL